MSSVLKTVAGVAVLASGVVAAAAVGAQNLSVEHGAMMEQGGMMGMMRHMSGMQSGCSQMMSATTGGGDFSRPNSQWREDVPPKKTN